MLLRITEVSELTGINVRTLYDLVKAGSFPRPRQVGKRMTRFHRDDVIAWMDGLDRSPCNVIQFPRTRKRPPADWRERIAEHISL